MATNNSVNVPLSGSSGTGAFAGTISPVFTTPNIGSGTGTASGNTTYSPNNHGVVVSSATNAMTVIAPVSSTTSILA